MKVSEFRRFRAEVVGALAAHPEWRKERRSSYDTVSYTHLTLPTTERV